MAFFDDLFGRLTPRPPIDVFGGQGLDAFGELMGDGSDALQPITPFGPSGGFLGGLGSLSSSSPSFWQMPQLGGDLGGFGESALPIRGTGIQPRGARSLSAPTDTFTPRRPGLFSKKPTTTGTTTPPAGTTTPGSGTAGDIWGVIDEEARDDPRLAQALKLAVQLESGGRADAVGDQGQSHGFYQIHQPAHGRNITPEQSRDPRRATQYRLAEFRASLDRVSRERPGLWESDPMSAAALTAFYAQRPAQPYNAANVQQAWQTIQQRQAAPQPAAAPATPEAAQGVQAAAIAEATKHVGKPYLLAAHANNPAANAFDCSGLVQWSFKTAGVALPRTAQEQFNATQRVTAAEVRPGDLVFFHSTYNAGTPVTHVGIALGNGQMMQAGSNGVGVVDLNTNYWKSHLYGFGRVA